MRHARFLRASDRAAEAASREAQAVAALERSSAHFRREGRPEVADALDLRAGAIREAAAGANAMPGAPSSGS